MKNWLPSLLVGVVLTSIAFADNTPKVVSPEWLEKIQVSPVGQFPLPTPRELHYTAGWSGVTAGKVRVTFAHDAKKQTLHATGGTIGLARTLFSLDANCAAECDPTTLAPRITTIVETYPDEKRTTIQRFSAEKTTRQRSSEPAQKDDAKVKTFRLPRLLDLQSSLLFLRSQPLQIGDQITFLAYATDSPYLAKVTVVKKETITVAAGKYPAIQLRLDLTGIDKKLQLKTYRKARDIHAWISDDADRLFLKFTGDLLVGHVFVELEK